MGAFDGLQLYGPDSWNDVIFDNTLVALKGQELHLARAEGI